MIRKYKYLILRRLIQVSILLLYIFANYYAIKILQGNLSSSLLFNTVTLSDPFAVLQMLSAGAAITFDILLGALLIVIFYSIIGNRTFCSWVCPVNIITDSANYLRRKFGFNHIQKNHSVSRNIRYWFFALSLVLSFLLGISAFESISPISITHRAIIFGFGISWAMILAIFLFDLFILKNGWCGHLCPLGAFYSIIGKKGIFKIVHDKDKCTACMHCKEVCPESHVLFMINKESIKVENSQCTSCARCIEVCNDDALNFSILNLKDKK